MSTITLDDIRRAQATLQALSTPKIRFNPMLENWVDTNHPRKLLKKFRFEPLWFFNWRQNRANKKHGFYYIIEPQIWLVDHDKLNKSLGLNFGFAINRGKEYIAHPIFKDLIEKAM